MSSEKLPIEYEYDDVMEMAKSDPDELWDDGVITALAMSNKHGSKLWPRFSGQLSSIKSINANEFKKFIRQQADQLEDGEDNSKEETQEEILQRIRENLPEVEKPDEETSWDEVQACVLKHFDQKTLNCVEALATVPIQLMFPEFRYFPTGARVGAKASL